MNLRKIDNELLCDLCASAVMNCERPVALILSRLGGTPLSQRAVKRP
ncbi:MAG: hypothetical protein V1871_00495 [Planctomycetota bacterium]